MPHHIRNLKKKTKLSKVTEYEDISLNLCYLPAFVDIEHYAH